jgi:hypothetical protein
MIAYSSSSPLSSANIYQPFKLKKKVRSVQKKLHDDKKIEETDTIISILSKHKQKEYKNIVEVRPSL